jgi:hypothetical protein
MEIIIETGQSCNKKNLLSLQFVFIFIYSIFLFYLIHHLIAIALANNFRF